LTLPDHIWKLQGEASETEDGIEAWFTVETNVAIGLGHVRLREGCCWTLFTSAQALRGHEEKTGHTREWSGTVSHYYKYENQDPYVVIVGGSQSGITLGARLKRLGVPHVILEKTEHAGGNWRSRYKSLCLHDPVWCTHLPYIPFPDHWPIYPSKDQLADWLEMYVKVMELNFWTKSTCTSATWDDVAKEWTVQVDRDWQKIILRPKHLVVATGVYGLPNIPHYEGTDLFQQEHELLHSSAYKNGDAYAGKKVAVIGSNTSAHDICADLYEHGVNVTMVQRSSTTIVGRTTLKDVLCGGLYSEDALENGISVEKADVTFASIPYAVLTETHKPLCATMRERDADILGRLEQRGFLLDFGDDKSGNFVKFLRSGTGYYFDCGASELVASGKVGLKVGKVACFNSKGLVMANGEEIAADVVVYATGYGPVNDVAAQFLGKHVAEKMGRVWGLGSGFARDPGPWEGEIRGLWKPMPQEGLWVHAGNLQMNRSYSKYLALQLQARYLDLPTPVYHGLTGPVAVDPILAGR